MQAPRMSEDVLPVGEFKTHVSQVIRQLRENRRPIVITQNGRPAAVLVTPEEYDRMMATTSFRESVLEGLRDSMAGRTVSDEELAAELETFLEGR